MVPPLGAGGFSYGFPLAPQGKAGWKEFFVVLPSREELFARSVERMMAFHLERSEEFGMKADKNGCSTTEAGQEQYEFFYSSIRRGWRVQYDYRTQSGKLFSCVAKTLDDARQKRDRWLEKQDA